MDIHSPSGASYFDDSAVGGSAYINGNFNRRDGFGDEQHCHKTGPKGCGFVILGCEQCGQLVHADSAEYAEDGIYCCSCGDDVTECTECGGKYYNTEEVDGADYCEDCADEARANMEEE